MKMETSREMKSKEWIFSRFRLKPNDLASKEYFEFKEFINGRQKGNPW